jgi:hypothetical protein
MPTATDFTPRLIAPGKTLIITNGLYGGHRSLQLGTHFQITATVKGVGGSLLLSNNFSTWAKGVLAKDHTWPR